jgi:hypothetical protein
VLRTWTVLLRQYIRVTKRLPSVAYNANQIREFLGF